MMRTFGFTALAVILGLGAGTTLPAYAQESGAAERAADVSASSYEPVTERSPWQVRVRAISVEPSESSTTSIQGSVSLDRAIVPELDISYFLDENWALELILATSPHEARALATTAGSYLDLGDVTLLPPTLTLQYHFLSEHDFRPYVGAGINYTVFYNEDAGSSINNIDYENTFGYAFQAGFDYFIDDNWGLNLDVKKIYINTDVSINSGAITADVDIDPLVVGAGVTYRF